MAKSNPNKANQHRPDPRQVLFLEYYLDRNSETFSNALQSALKAGYTKEYSENILQKDLTWLAENVGDVKFIEKAEKNLDELLDEKEDKRIKADITKFVLSRLHKKKWSERHEHTGADGQAIKIEEKTQSKIDSLISGIFKK